MITSTSNNAFIESEQYSSFILRNMEDGMLPENFFRDVSDFGHGETLNIKSIGEAQIQEITENEDIVFNPIETGNITMTITDYVGDGWYVTDKMRQDGNQIEALTQARAEEAVRAIQEFRESQALAVLNASQTPGDQNLINGFAHRVAAGAGGTADQGVISLGDLIRMKLAFDKAEVPAAGRILIVDPVVGATLNSLYQSTANVDSNPMMQEILNSGFSRDHDYIMTLFGWSIMSSNRLPKQSGTETIDGEAIVDPVANIFMCIVDDQTKALMSAWRQQPRVEGERNISKQRDEFVQTARWGFGAQRVDTLGVLLTSQVEID